MKFFRLRIAAAVCVVCMTFINIPAWAAQTVIHVSPAGNDSTADGSRQHPYQTFAAAKNAARRYIKNEGGVEVLFHKGTYKIDNTISFNTEDSGMSAESPVIYKAYGDGEVIFTGSVKLNGSNFENITDVEILKRLPENARTKIKQYDLTIHGLNFSKNDDTYPQLFADNEQQTEARYPNYGYLDVDVTDNYSDYFITYDSHANGWDMAYEAVAVGSFDSSYGWSLNKVTGISEDAVGYKIEIGRSARNDAQWYIKNLLEEIDMPGEYFVDRNTNILYYYPVEEDVDNINFELTDVLDKNIIDIDSGVSNITFDGLSFEKFGGSAITTKGNNSNINIINCNFKFLQADMVLKIYGQDCNITDNYAYSCAGGFISFSGGNYRTLERGNMVIANNRISACGYNLTGGIILAGVNSVESSSVVGNTVRNNIIQDCTTTHGISIPGNNSKVVYNEIYNQGRHISDGGAIYFGRSNTKYGNEVAYNYIHDLNLYLDDSSKYFCGLYSDDGYGGISMHHNVLENMERAMIAGVGMNCNFSNNLMINCRKGLFLQTRMDFGGSGTADTMYNEALLLSRYSYKNVYYAQYPDMEKALTRVPYFAPWNTVAVGNVSISDNGNVNPLLGVPSHRYIDSYNGDTPVYVIPGENEVEGIEDAIFTSNGTEYVNEMEAYGTKIYDDEGNNMNATSYGNLQLTYDSSYFVDDTNKNYTLTGVLDSELEGISTVNEIDMTAIGVINTTNSNIFNNTADKVALSYPKDGENNVKNTLTLSWERVENASNYTVVVSENSDLSSPVYNETIWGNHSNTACNPVLEQGRTYYWRVTANAIGRQDSFSVSSDIQSFTTASSDYVNKQNAQYALTLLNNDILLGEEGIYIYTDEMMAMLKQEAAAAQSILDDITASQEETDALENKLYNLIAEAEEGQQTILPQITRCEPDQTSDMVYIEGNCFKPGSAVSVLVTNPNYNLQQAAEDRTLETIQYAGVIKCDEYGKFSLSFSTNVDGADMPGEYSVYVTDSMGRKLEKKYIYATVELGAVIFKSTDGEEIVDLSQYRGQTVKAECSIINRLPAELNANAVTSIFENNKLVGVSIDKDIKLLSNTSTNIQWDVLLPDIDNIELKILLWEDITSMRPLTTVRVITQSE